MALYDAKERHLVSLVYRATVTSRRSSLDLDKSVDHYILSKWFSWHGLNSSTGILLPVAKGVACIEYIGVATFFGWSMVEPVFACFAVFGVSGVCYS